MPAAASLGAAPWTAFRRVLLPLARPGILSGALLVLMVLIGYSIRPRCSGARALLSYPVQGPSLRWFQELATEATWRRSILNSLLIGGAATALSVALGTAGALGLRDGPLPFGGALRTVALLPMVVPAVVLGVGLQVPLTPLGLANTTRA